MAVQDLQRQEELSSVVALGVCAEDIVLTAGRLSRGQRDEGDTSMAEYAAAILRSLGNSASPFGSPSDKVGFMSSDGFIDTIRAVRAHAPNHDVQSYSERLAATLESAARGEDPDAAAREDLERVRDVFGAIGRTAIARANDLSQSSRD